MIADLEVQWTDLATGYTEDESLVQRLWIEIYRAYSAEDRHYHNLRHINNLLDLAEQYEAQLQQANLVRFAIFYHDLIYEPTQKDNEERSAKKAAKRLQELGLAAEASDAVSEMILATKGHSLHADPDTNYLVDFDLSVLGAAWDKYQTYAKQIREEYSLYPDELYNQGRKKVLCHFLEQDSIFKTSHFRERLEAKARENLQWEIDILS